MTATTHSFCKEERLCGERAISNLFDHGHTFFYSPYKVFWIKTTVSNAFPSRFAVSAPKRRFKHAVKRNLLKRRTREAFRINKQILNTVVAEGQQVHLMVIYASDRILPLSDMENAMKKILLRIAQQYAESD